MSKLSILLPFKNASKTLHDCLISIQHQTETEFECVAINDHSQDDSESIVLALNDSRFKVMQNPGYGLVDALNWGIEISISPLIFRMDSDDIMTSDRLSKQKQEMENNPEIAVLGSRVSLFPEDKIQAGYSEYIRWQNSLLSQQAISNQIFVESPFAHPSVVFRKEAIEELGGYREGDFPEDYDLWLRCWEHKLIMAKLPDYLLNWRESSGRLSRTSPIYARRAFDRLRAEYLSRDPRLQGGRPIVVWGAGRKTRKRVKHLQSRGIKVTAWIDIDPKKIGNVIDQSSVYTPTWLMNQSPRPFVLNYVTNHGARELIMIELNSMGFSEGADYLSIG